MMYLGKITSLTIKTFAKKIKNEIKKSNTIALTSGSVRLPIFAEKILSQ